MKYRIVLSVAAAGLLAVMGCVDKPADTLPEDHGIGTSPSDPTESSASFVVVATDMDAGIPDATLFEENSGVIIIQRPGTIGADDDGTK